MNINKPIVATSFNTAYESIIRNLNSNGEKSTTRKGSTITELYDAAFVILDPQQCWAYCRKPSLEYLEKEFQLYTSGSDKLSDAVRCSKFWQNCSDDGETINSNYGKLLFHDKNAHGNTQFNHAVNCLVNNIRSKKAVMTLYDKENAYISNDNPCTMFLRARVDEHNRLHLTAYMRSSDIYFGLPYDVPFFVFVQLTMVRVLRSHGISVQMGTYTHIASSLHMYHRNERALSNALKHGALKIGEVQLFNNTWDRIVTKGQEVLKKHGCIKEKDKFMAMAWQTSKQSTCLKKKVGCCLTYTELNGDERVIAMHAGDVIGPSCKTCLRDDPKEIFYGDECHSVHAEMRCLNELWKGRMKFDMARCTCYVTHNCCDACAKLLDLVGIKQVYYDKPYKIDESRWPNITFTQIDDK